MGITSLTVAASASLVWYLTPSDIEKPVVTIYMKADCKNCRRWMVYLSEHGFRTSIGEDSDWPEIRARFKLPPNFRGTHTAIVDGLLLEGHVPTSAIHTMLRRSHRDHVRGLVVQGSPRGSPGLDSPFPQPYTVFEVLDSGLMRPLETHNDGMHR